MSHEMRTPMNAIMGMLSIARSATEIERKEYCLDRISEASQHLMGVINDILDTAKIESDKLELSYDRVDFREMVRRVTNLASFSVNERRQKLVVEVDENIPCIITDGQRLAQVVSNLLSNAVKFTPEEGGISLTAKKIAEDDGLCTIRCLVKDTGIGISDEQRRQLFRPFEQADGSINRKFGGTGLGLAISKHLVEMMGGRIWVESELGSGASFFFEISARRADEPQTKDGAPREELHAAAAEGVSDDNIFEGKRILIAEDVDINREIIDALLTHTGVEISFARNGAEAVDKFASAANGFDLILMDIHMPDVDGYEATRRIRASALPGSDTTPIIAMTANVFREDVERCLACGMNDHIGKPVDKDRVIAKLRTYLLQA
jgi:CheY-like chemotaxis protein